VLDLLQEKGEKVLGVGKIGDIFAWQGVDSSHKTKNNLNGIENIISLLTTEKKGLIFANLNDFDTLYGHRNNVPGYAAALEEFDQHLPAIMERLEEGDLLIITADHGCDPTTPSTDHSREHVPLLVFYPDMPQGIDLGIRSSFADIAQTIAEVFALSPLKYGKSFAKEVGI